MAFTIMWVSPQAQIRNTNKLHTIKRSLTIPKGGNQNPYIEEEQTSQSLKEKVQKDKQRSTTYSHKTKDRVTITH
jgi:hypothetical protein